MARKRLSDLLREEVQKPTEESVTDATAATSETIEVVAETVDVTAIAARDTVLQQQLDDLKTQFQDQIAELKAEIKQHTTANKKLQTSLEKAEQQTHQLTTELETARQTILQLAENNAQLKKDLDAAQVAQRPTTPSRSPAPSRPSLPVPAAPVPVAPTQSPRSLTQQEVLRRRQADSLAHPVFPVDKLQGQGSEPDVGWFD